MKNILLIAHDDVGQEARLQAALDVTRAVDGHLTCLDVSIMPALVGDCDGAGSAMLLADEREREHANRAKLASRLAHEDIRWDMIDACGSLGPCVNEASALADLIVVSRKLEKFPLPDMLVAAGEIIVKSRRPILAVPDAANGLDLTGAALVAWDGSRAAAAALQAAVPLLRLSSAVELLEAGDGSVDIPAEQAAAYFSRHGIHTAIRRTACDRRHASDRLLEEVRGGKVSYVVMGGFGHRRFVEAVLGGVTRTMLSESPVPLFMAR